MTKLAVRASCVRFSPDGRSWAAASTEGLLVYSLDEGMRFDPSGLDLHTTPAAVGAAAARSALPTPCTVSPLGALLTLCTPCVSQVGAAAERGDYSAAMPMALCLNEVPLIRAVFQATPPEHIELVARSIPPLYLARLLSFFGAELDTSRHLHAILLWLQALLVWHGARLRDERSTHEVALRTIHKGVLTRYDELGATCHSNTHLLDFLADQLEANVAAAERAADDEKEGAKRGRVELA